MPLFPKQTWAESEKCFARGTGRNSVRRFFRETLQRKKPALFLQFSCTPCFPRVCIRRRRSWRQVGRTILLCSLRVPSLTGESNLSDNSFRSQTYPHTLYTKSSLQSREERDLCVFPADIFNRRRKSVQPCLLQPTKKALREQTSPHRALLPPT